MDRKTFVGWQAVSVLALLALVAAGAAANSNTVSYQGVLRDAAQAPVADDSYDMRFSIWDDATAGAKQWGDEDQSVTTRNGLFSVNLGSVVALDTVFADYAALWLQIEVDLGGGAGFELYAPRVPLASVPYAQKALYAQNAVNAANATNAVNAANAANADTLDGHDTVYFATASHVHDGTHITTGTVPFGRLPVAGTGSASTVAKSDHNHGYGVSTVSAGNWTGTSSYTVITGLTRTITAPPSGAILVNLVSVINQTNAAADAWFQIVVSGTGGSTQQIAGLYPNALADFSLPVSASYVFTGLSGSITVSVQGRGGGGLRLRPGVGAEFGQLQVVSLP